MMIGHFEIGLRENRYMCQYFTVKYQCRFQQTLKKLAQHLPIVLAIFHLSTKPDSTAICSFWQLHKIGFQYCRPTIKYMLICGYQRLM